MDDAREITREEAIANLNMISVAFVEPVTEEQRKLIDDTFDMAIKALEQEPSEDAIRRQAVLDLAKKGVLISNGNYKSVCKAINEIPSVNPTNTGHWIDGWVNEYKTCPKVTCSECGIDGTLSYKEYKYCPNCGAKMESEEV